MVEAIANAATEYFRFAQTPAGQALTTQTITDWADMKKGVQKGWADLTRDFK